jgi:hypothetical protein
MEYVIAAALIVIVGAFIFKKSKGGTGSGSSKPVDKEK